LNATNIGSFFTVTGGAVDVVGGPLFGWLCSLLSPGTAWIWMAAPGRQGRSAGR
jgi:hypothetical protein